LEPLSIFDIYKIGVGPSSSHTLGPWRAALKFREKLIGIEYDKIAIHLYGSLSKTGRGHATDQAVILGLLGFDPTTIDTHQLSIILEEVKINNLLIIDGKPINFNPKSDIIFESYEHKRHPNTLKFLAFGSNDLVLEELFASVGGGFIESEFIHEETSTIHCFPHPIFSGEDLIEHTDIMGTAISDVVFENEKSFMPDIEIRLNITRIFDTMLQCVYEGCTTEGTLPGGLNVNRRAKTLSEKLIGNGEFFGRSEWLKAISDATKDFHAVNKWVSCFALAVNEQNAAMSRVVTSPTNGAAGVIPAVLLYYMLFCDFKGEEDIYKFFLTSGQIGCLFKQGATISAAVGGCQAEIGVSSSMAAAGLTEVMGGTPEQCLMAAEIAMEHHLGLTCDPIGGLVQVPCIERNAMGAIKAITASNLALMGDAKKAIVKFDTVIKTMWDTAQDMNLKYKETSEGGLAINIPVINPNC